MIPSKNKIQAKGNYIGNNYSASLDNAVWIKVIDGTRIGWIWYWGFEAKELAKKYVNK